MSEIPSWLEALPVAVTVTAADGTITDMNGKAREVFAASGGGDLVGKSVFDCHPSPAIEKTRALFRDRTPNHYTIEKRGQKKIVHQLPWFDDGEFGGIVEISIPIPGAMPHFNRDV